MFNLTHLCVILHGTFVSKSQIYVFIYNVNFRMMLYCITMLSCERVLHQSETFTHP